MKVFIPGSSSKLTLSILSFLSIALFINRQGTTHFALASFLV